MPVDPLLLRLLRWSARLLGALLVGLVFLIAAGEGLPRADQLGAREWSLFLALAAIVFGHLLLWFHAVPGATVGLAGYALFLGIQGDLLSPRLTFIHQLALPSMLALLAAFWSQLRRNAGSGHARPSAVAPGSPAHTPLGTKQSLGPEGSDPSPK